MITQGAALLGGSIDALHSSFPANADDEYSTQGILVLFDMITMASML